MTTVVHYQLLNRQCATAIGVKTSADEYYACGMLKPNYPVPALNYSWPRPMFWNLVAEGWCKAKVTKLKGRFVIGMDRDGIPIYRSVN